MELAHAFLLKFMLPNEIMAKLIKEFELSNNYTSTIHIVKSQDYLCPMDTIKEVNTIHDQGFVWYKNFVGFLGMSDTRAYWVRIFVSDNLELEPDTRRAIVVPFQVPHSNILYMDNGDNLFPFPMKSGYYQLLFETRELTEEEVKKLPRFAQIYLRPSLTSNIPQLVKLTFIPTEGMTKPEILVLKGGSIKKKVGDDDLVLFDEEKLESEENSPII